MTRNSFAGQLETVRSEFKPDVIILAELAWIRLIDFIQGWNIPIIYDAHNVEVNRFQELVHASRASELSLRRAREAAEAELRMTSAAAQIWACSHLDRDMMEADYGVGKKTVVIPNGVDLLHYLNERSRSETVILKSPSYNLLYTGDFSYAPNTIAAERICSKLMPEFRKRLAGVRLYLVGVNPTPSMLELAASHFDIIVTGKVPDIRPYLSGCSCMVVPLEYGGGTRLKILEAFAAGCPVVSTPKGAEGLMVASGKHLLIGSTNQDLIERTVDMCLRPDISRAMTINARNLVESMYNWPTIHKLIREAIARLGLSVEGSLVPAGRGKEDSGDCP